MKRVVFRTCFWTTISLGTLLTIFLYNTLLNNFVASNLISYHDPNIEISYFNSLKNENSQSKAGHEKLFFKLKKEHPPKAVLRSALAYFHEEFYSFKNYLDQNSRRNFITEGPYQIIKPSNATLKFEYPNISFQVHSWDDPALFSFGARTGIRFFKVDMFYVSSDEQCQKLLKHPQNSPETLKHAKGCFLLTHDPPTKFENQFNGFGDLVQAITSKDLLEILKTLRKKGEKLQIAFCFKYFYSIQSAIDKMSLRTGVQIDSPCYPEKDLNFIHLINETVYNPLNQFAKENDLDSSTLEFVLDESATPGGKRQCLSEYWRDWPSTFVSIRDPWISFFTNEQNNTASHRFKILNEPIPTKDTGHHEKFETLIFDRAKLFGFGKFSKSHYPFIVWEPANQKEIWVVSSSYLSNKHFLNKKLITDVDSKGNQEIHSSYLHSPGLKFSTNIDPTMFQVFSSRFSNFGWNKRLSDTERVKKVHKLMHFRNPLDNLFIQFTKHEKIGLPNLFITFFEKQDQNKLFYHVSASASPSSPFFLDGYTQELKISKKTEENEEIISNFAEIPFKNKSFFIFSKESSKKQEIGFQIFKFDPENEEQGKEKGQIFSETQILEKKQISSKNEKVLATHSPICDEFDSKKCLLLILLVNSEGKPIIRGYMIQFSEKQKPESSKMVDFVERITHVGDITLFRNPDDISIESGSFSSLIDQNNAKLVKLAFALGTKQNHDSNGKSEKIFAISSKISVNFKEGSFSMIVSNEIPMLTSSIGIGNDPSISCSRNTGNNEEVVLITWNDGYCINSPIHNLKENPVFCSGSVHSSCKQVLQYAILKFDSISDVNILNAEDYCNNKNIIKLGNFDRGSQTNAMILAPISKQNEKNFNFFVIESHLGFIDPNEELEKKVEKDTKRSQQEKQEIVDELEQKEAAPGKADSCGCGKAVPYNGLVLDSWIV